MIPMCLQCYSGNTIGVGIIIKKTIPVKEELGVFNDNSGIICSMEATIFRGCDITAQIKYA